MRTLACLLCLAGTVALAAAAPSYGQQGANCRTGPCPAAWQPVCACTCDGAACRTFHSPCSLHYFNCHSAPDYYYVRSGTCEIQKREHYQEDDREIQKREHYQEDGRRDDVEASIGGYIGFGFNNDFLSDFMERNKNFMSDFTGRHENFMSDFTGRYANFMPDFTGRHKNFLSDFTGRNENFLSGFTRMKETFLPDFDTFFPEF